MPPIHHVGYVVDDLQSAAAAMWRTYGAGPFLAMEHLEFDEVTYLGEPAAYDHSAAFGAWGPILVELNVVHSAAPPALQEALGRPGIGHAGFVVDDLDAVTERFLADGLRLFHEGRTGPAHARWFDGAPALAHHVEVLQSNELLQGFYARVRAAADGFDGAEPLRSARR
ncbi:MAG TPA: VOC family protein [Solirubrobacteraceae bacterium]|nr:VOC family protein [Solirubrobacteraceae bacterium]